MPLSVHWIVKTAEPHVPSPAHVSNSICNAAVGSTGQDTSHSAMATNVVHVGTLCSFISLLVVLIALYYKSSVDDVLKERLNVLLDGLVRVEQQHKHVESARPRVAVGYGACLDLFVDGKDLLDPESMTGKPEHFNDIGSYSELLKSYAYFFRHGAAAERFVSNSELFSEIVDRAATLENSHYALGGNAPVMAARFLMEGCDVLLAAKMTPSLQKHLPEGIKVVGGDVSADDVHLILEYKAGEVWGKYQTQRANRFIVHNDANNPLVSSLEAMDPVLREFRPDLFVVSGLQMMDNFPFKQGVREERLSRVRDQMVSQSPDTRVHFEMASFADAGLLSALARGVVPFADSLGMNEQELANLWQTETYGNVSLVADSNPRVATVLDQMRMLFRLLQKSRSNVAESRELTRLHVHTLAYQAILTLDESPWKQPAVAAAKASLTAHRHVCGTSQVNIDKATLLLDESFSVSLVEGSRRVPLDPASPVSCWAERSDGWSICVAPVLVCTRAHHTAGAGDNISSAGLAMQL